MTDNRSFAQTCGVPAQPEKDGLRLAFSRLQRRCNLALGIAFVALVVSICVVVWARWG